MSNDLLEVHQLHTRFASEDRDVHAVAGVSFRIEPGRTLGLVGESGSGKSVTSLSLMRLLPETATLEGRISFLGRDLVALPERDLRALRGGDVAMIFQEPMTALNPVLRVGAQVAEALSIHRKVSNAEARNATIELLREVGIPDPETRIDSYPHEMSGGQKQRVMIAMALACDPKLLIADEPTTALDVTIQAQILDLLREIRDRRGMAMLFITHDLGVIAEIADDVAVMYHGQIVESGPVLEVFSHPRHPYTKGLLACRPRLDTPYTLLPTVDDFLEVRHTDGAEELIEKTLTEDRLRVLTAPLPRPAPATEPLLRVEGLSVHFPARGGLWGGSGAPVRAVDDVSFDILPGTTLGLVGESGSGKTTTGRAILRLIEPTAGRVKYQGVDLATLPERELRQLRRDLQIIFQDPYGSLNPRQTVEQLLTEPMQVHGLGAHARERRDRAAALLQEVGLRPDHLSRYPHEFSGGQRQRLCIARAVGLEPRLIICDEAVSALDVSVQAQVLNLLRMLQQKHGLTYLFISHDLAVVKFMSDDVAVMQHGRIVEKGPAAKIYERPAELYTQRLIAAIPRDDLEHIRALQATRSTSPASHRG
jgi:peptide/nickel transport system ATP-binding protein